MILKKLFGRKVEQPKAHTDGEWIPASIMHSLSGGGKSKAGVVINEQTALFSSAVFACQRAISESLASLPKGIFKKTADGGREAVEQHPSANIFRREANNLQTTYKFFETLQHHVLSRGNGYAEIQRSRNTGKAVALWPIPPERVTPEVVDIDGNLTLIYQIRRDDGTMLQLDKDQILHIPGLGYDGIRGYPVLLFMLNAIGLGAALEEYGSLFFKQGAGVPGYVSMPDTFTEEQIKNMRRHMAIQNEGLDNAHRWKFLYESAKFQPAGATPDQSQMVESRIFQIQEIARFYRIPLHKIQETSKSTSYNSLEQFNIEFVTDTLGPWIVNWEQELNRKLFINPSDSDLYIRFNTNALLRGDSQGRSTFYRTMVMSGIMSRNEVRALEELPPVDGGDEMLTPSNMQSNRSLDATERVQD